MVRAWLRWLVVLLTLAGLAATARAATYTYRSDTYAWESAANAVTWSRSCVSNAVDDDSAVISFTGGFTFRFAGTNYNAVRILTNGMLQFGADTGFQRNYTNTTLPATTTPTKTGCPGGAPTNILLAYWTDLNPARAGSGQVTWEQKGTAPNRYFVVSWNSVYHFNSGLPYSLQIILYENGEFKYQYGAGNATGSDGTIGVQVSTTDYTLYSYNSGNNANGTAIRWFIPNTTPQRVADFRFEETSWSGTLGEVKDSSGNSNHGCASAALPARPTAASAAVWTCRPTRRRPVTASIRPCRSTPAWAPAARCRSGTPATRPGAARRPRC